MAWQKRLSTNNSFLCEKKSFVAKRPPEKAKRGGRKSRSHDRHTKEVLKAQDSPNFFLQRFLSISEPLCKICYYGRQQTNKRENYFPCSFIYRKLAHDFLRLPPPSSFLFERGRRGGGLAPAEGKEKRGEERVYVRSMPVVGRRRPEKDHKCTKPPPITPIPGNRQATTGNESCRLFLSLSLSPPFFLGNRVGHSPTVQRSDSLHHAHLGKSSPDCDVTLSI